MSTQYPATYWNNQSVREVEHTSIRMFVQQAADAGMLSGRVLDYGCGRQPYRPIVEAAGGEYHGYDRAEFPANISEVDVGDDELVAQDWDTILCNQVVQYDPHTRLFLAGLWGLLAMNRGLLVMTFPTCWDEVEPEDLVRFTAQGMRWLLTDVGFEIVSMVRRAEVNVGGFRFPLGYGVVGRAR